MAPQPKETKPKLEAVEGGGGGLPLIPMLLMAVVIVIGSAAASAASVYFLAPIVLKPLIAQAAPAGEGGDDGAAGADGEKKEGDEPKEPTVGPVLALDEFTVNLKDPGGQKYLRANLSLTIAPEKPAEFEKLAGEAMKKWEEEFHGEMSHYVPTIRDIIISALTKRTAADLSTVQGKEALKSEIKKNAEGVLGEKHKIIRVNIENFIIQ